MQRTLLAFAIGAAIPLVAAISGVSKALGAHPFWDIQTAVVGVPLGIVVALAATRLPRGPAILGLVVVTIAAAVAAHFGRTAFAASFAENTLAGQFWYFGWIALAAMLTATITTALLALTPGPQTS